jgi:hypothetical protein
MLYCVATCGSFAGNRPLASELAAKEAALAALTEAMLTNARPAAIGFSEAEYSDDELGRGSSAPAMLQRYGRVA